MILLDYIRNITKCYLTKDALTKSESQYRILATNTLDVVWSTDLEFNMTFVNNAVFDFIGYTPEEFTGTNSAEFTSFEGQETLRRIAKILLTKFKEGILAQEKAEIQQIRKDGTVMMVEITANLLLDDNGEVVGFQGRSIDITDKKQAEADLHNSVKKWTSTFEAMTDSICLVDLDRNISECNSVTLDMFGITKEDIKNKKCWELIIGETEPCKNCLIDNLKNSEKPKSISFTKGDRNLSLSIYPIYDEENKITSVVHVTKDITESLKQEEQLTQMRKIESIGMLAGGVAHDFNNMLMSIMGYAELCRDSLKPDNPGNKWLDEIIKATNRSADLTRQLLSFARKEVITPVVLDLNDTISGMLKMLRRLISENVDMIWQPGVDVWKVKLDPGQVNQILANLCVNARDAIDGSGTVTIETKNIAIDNDFCVSHIEAIPGDYIALWVQDNGCGMDQNTLKHIFEPFYTTKDAGKGTGLGLSTTHGIVKQNKGFITIESKLGAGTTFKIYLPRFIGEELADQGEETSGAVVGGNETILLVEDEKSIRTTTKILLEDLGYTLLVAESPAIALELISKHDGRVHLLVTDIIMPGISGRELAEKLVADDPELKILYMSGYTADVIANNGILDDDINFLEKPFSRDTLATKVREVIDA